MNGSTISDAKTDVVKAVCRAIDYPVLILCVLLGIGAFLLFAAHTFLDMRIDESA